MRLNNSNIQLGEITLHNVKLLKIVNQVVFPVSYNEKFYKDILNAGELAKLAYFNDIVVGAVCCRIELVADKSKLYIMTLGCLAPYRNLGIGSHMLEHIFKICEKDPNIASIYLHVQTSNDTALKFYQKFGFEIKDTIHHYYKRIDPPDAYILEKNLDKISQIIL